MTVTPALSIVVMTRNRCAELERCLDSLTRQDAAPELYEIVVVDDGSTDETRSVVRGFESSKPAVRYAAQSPSGIAAARNAGLKCATGRWVAFVADDYLIPRNYVTHILSFFEENPDAAAVRFRIAALGERLCERVCHFYFDIDIRNNLGTADRSPGLSTGMALRKLVRRLPQHGDEPTANHTLSASGAAAYRADVLRGLGGFDESLVCAEDTDLARRMRRNGFVLYYDPRLRVHRKYNPTLLGAFRSHLRAGYHFALYQRRVGATTAARQIPWAFMALLARPPWRARQAGSLRTSLLYLPFLFWLDLGHCIGLASGAVHVSFRSDQPSAAGLAQD